MRLKILTPLIAFTTHFLCFARGQRAKDSDDLDFATGQSAMRKAVISVINHPLYGQPAKVYSCPDKRSMKSAGYFIAEAFSHGHQTIEIDHPAFNIDSLPMYEDNHLAKVEDGNDAWLMYREMRGRLMTGLLCVTRDLVNEARAQLISNQTLINLPASKRCKQVFLFGPCTFISLAAPVHEKIPKCLQAGDAIIYTCVLELQQINRVWTQCYRISQAEYLPVR